MKIKKKLAALALAVSTLATATAGAEHPSAEQYRQILQSGNFYLEYETVGDTQNNLQNLMPGQGTVDVLASESGRRMASTIALEHKKKTGWGSRLLGIDVGDSKVVTKRGEKVPNTLYMNGNYYIFHPEGVSPSTSMTDIRSFMEQVAGKKKKQEAQVCSATQLNAPALDRSEGWEDVREHLALPDALSIFANNDSYQDKKGRMRLSVSYSGILLPLASYYDDNVPPKTAPVFVESRKVTIDKKEYDCDRYASDFRTVGGTVVAQVLYDAVYDEEGKLTKIQRYFSRHGKTESLGAVLVLELTSQLPEDAFFISAEPMKVYAAGMGDANDFLEIGVPVGTIGGASANAK